MTQRFRVHFARVAILALVMAACGGDDDTADETTTTTAEATTTTEAGETTTTEASEEEPMGDPIQVGIVTSTSGALQGYGNQYLDGLEDRR